MAEYLDKSGLQLVINNTKDLIDAAVGTQADWLQTDPTKMNYIKNKPNAYVKPETGIPSDDLSGAVQESLNKADSALQSDALLTYALTAEAGYDLGLSIDEKTYIMTLELKNKAGEVISQKTLDFPIESLVIGASYADGKITLTLQSGDTLDVDISKIVGGLVNDSFTIAGIDMKDDITVEELKTALGVPLIYYGTTTPSDSLGKNGDIYIKKV